MLPCDPCPATAEAEPPAPPRRRHPGRRGPDLPSVAMLLPDGATCLSVAQVAEHWRLTPATVGAMLRTGTLRGVRVNRLWRTSWHEVWAVEDGPRPQGARCAALRRPLLRKADLAASRGVSVRTVERWLADGLPTRDVGASVRIAPADADIWLAGRFGLPVAPTAT